MGSCGSQSGERSLAKLCSTKPEILEFYQDVGVEPWNMMREMMIPVTTTFDLRAIETTSIETLLRFLFELSHGKKEVLF